MDYKLIEFHLDHVRLPPPVVKTASFALNQLYKFITFKGYPDGEVAGKGGGGTSLYNTIMYFIYSLFL